MWEVLPVIRWLIRIFYRPMLHEIPLRRRFLAAYFNEQ